jgi:hypothetical protein
MGARTEKEKGYRTGPPGYIGWRNHSLESIPGLHKRLKIWAQSVRTTVKFHNSEQAELAVSANLLALV